MSITGKQLRRWMPGYVRHVLKNLASAPLTAGQHLLVAVCDHHEPRWGQPSDEIARARVDYWCEHYPRLCAAYRDSDGRAPQHSFFFPGEEYSDRLFDGIDSIVRAGLGEVELHLHHDADTPDGLREKIRSYLELYAARGHFSRTSAGEIRYAFIHGNWALANGRPDGRACGVDAELPILFDTGCYADFTFPSCPDPTQPGIVNAIYWPTGDLSRRRAYDGGEMARVGKTYTDRVLMITGPLALSRREGRGLPRIEYGALTAHDPGTYSRARTWAGQRIAVGGRPEWIFVKLYTHGSPEKQAASLLGDGGRRLHDGLAELAHARKLALHYVTAREMYNIARAAMAEHAGNPNDYRDFALAPPPIRATVQSSVRASEPGTS